jgi:eukaryotic-like serine/threonine-protein kinase
MSSAGILGRTLGGRFRVTGFIGEGAMASVYRGVQEAEPHDVALKIMHAHLVSDATFVGRFRREARAAARIVHPNTVKILDTGVDGKILYIAMELLAGQDLFETLVLERRLSEARAVRILVQVTEALVAAHEKGVVHRDLKPENIMLLRDPEDPSREDVKVLDFGIAKILEGDTPSMDGTGSSHSALTGVGTVVGTPAYMSPEQCRGEPVDTRSDVYTCGILLYQLVAGRLPFTSENAMDLAVMHVRTPPTPLETVVPAVSPRLTAVIMTALSKWPSQRQQTAVELRDALQAILPELSDVRLALAVPTVAPEPPGPTPEALAAKEATTLPPAAETAAEREAGERAAAAVDEATSTPLVHDKPVRRAPEAAAPAPVVKKPAAAAKKPAPALVPVARARPARRAQKRGALASWWIVPFALALGVALGAVAFLLSRR